MALLEKLISLIDANDSGDSFFALKNMLSIAASALPRDGGLPEAASERAAFKRVQECLYELRKPTRPALRPDGIIWRGRPSFLTDEVLQSLLDEVEKFRPVAEPQKWGQHISPGGHAVARFANSPELLQLVEANCGTVEDKSYPSCLYYDSPGAHIKPHVDTDNFCVNVNLMLRHDAKEAPTSALIIYPFDDEPKRIELVAGEMIIMYADCVVHTRTPVGEGEIVRNITFGYKPAAEIHQNADRQRAENGFRAT